MHESTHHLPRSLLPVLSQYYSIWRSRASFCADGSCLLLAALFYLFFFSIRAPFFSFLPAGLLPFSALSGAPLLRSALRSMCLPAPCFWRAGSWPSRRSLLKPPFGCKDLNVLPSRHLLNEYLPALVSLPSHFTTLLLRRLTVLVALGTLRAVPVRTFLVPARFIASLLNFDIFGHFQTQLIY